LIFERVNSAVIMTAIILIIKSSTFTAQIVDDNKWTRDFNVDKNDFVSTGRNTFFILKPGYQLVLEGNEENGNTKVIITVKNETKIIDGVRTRVVEEKEYNNGIITEISKNYYAIDRVSNSVFYFGEDVDIYKDNKIISHKGSWMDGKNGAKFGLMMPGATLLESQYYQEVAPGIAMDRAKIISENKSINTPLDNFSSCLEIEESSPLEPGVKEYKVYAPNVGLIKDDNLLLVKYGCTKLKN
jgi:hypothetical protein